MNRDPKKRSKVFSWREFHPLEASPKKKKVREVNVDELYAIVME